MLGESDERYKVRGGNQRVVDELAKRRASRRSSCCTGSRPSAARARASRSRSRPADGAVDEDADIVVLTIPFTMLREVKIDVELPAVKQQGDRGARLRRQRQGAGRLQEPAVGEARLRRQRSTATSRSSSPGPTATCSRARRAASRCTRAASSRTTPARAPAEEVAARLMRGIERAYPGTLRERNGKVSRFHWPTLPVDQGRVLLLQAGPVDDDRRRRRACRWAISSSPASTAATISRAT